MSNPKRYPSGHPMGCGIYVVVALLLLAFLLASCSPYFGDSKVRNVRQLTDGSRGMGADL